MPSDARNPGEESSAAPTVAQPKNASPEVSLGELRRFLRSVAADRGAQ